MSKHILMPSNEHHKWLMNRDWPAVEVAMIHPARNVDLLVRKYRERDEHGRLAHHWLAAKAQTHTHTLALVGVQSICLHFEALITRDNKGETPIDIARRSGACAEIIGMEKRKERLLGNNSYKYNRFRPSFLHLNAAVSLSPLSPPFTPVSLNHNTPSNLFSLSLRCFTLHIASLLPSLYTRSPLETNSPIPIPTPATLPRHLARPSSLVSSLLNLLIHRRSCLSSLGGVALEAVDARSKVVDLATRASPVPGPDVPLKPLPASTPLALSAKVGVGAISLLLLLLLIPLVGVAEPAPVSALALSLLWCVVLCCVVLCCGVLCCVVVWCCGVVCCVVLSCVEGG